MLMRSCKQCHKELTRTQKRYCSQVCRLAYQKKHNIGWGGNTMQLGWKGLNGAIARGK